MGPMSDWIFKSVPALCQEAGIVMSCGGAFTIYDTPNRWGPVVSWHMDDLADVARFCRARQAFSQNTATVPQAVVLHSQNHYYAHNRSLYDLSTAARPVEGALYALLENTIHTGSSHGDHTPASGWTPIPSVLSLNRIPWIQRPLRS